MSRVPHVLILGDHGQATGRLAGLLGDAGYSVQLQSNGAAEVRTDPPGYGVVIIDWNGLKVCRLMRQTGWNTPVLMLTERAGIEDKVQAFEEGVDDYVTVPFHAEELIARLGALLRRHDIVRAGELILNVRERVAFWSARRLELTAREFKLLHLLVRNAGRVLSRDQILRAIGGIKAAAGSNVVDVHIRNLRSKLGPGAVHLRSVRGMGYCYEPGRIEGDGRGWRESATAGPGSVARTTASRRPELGRSLAQGKVPGGRSSASGAG